MGLKYNISDVFRGRFIIPQKLFEMLEDLDSRIEEGVESEPVVKKDVKLTKSSLKKSFGDPKKFNKIGVVHNSEGSYLVIASGSEFKIISFENI